MWNRSEHEQDGARLTAVPRPASEPQQTASCLGSSVAIKGDIIGTEDLVVNGRLEGSISLGECRLTVGQGACVLASLSGRVITVSGYVRGDVVATEKVEVLESGSVEGNVRAPLFAMREGATLSGRVDTERLPAIVIEERPEPQPLALAV